MSIICARHLLNQFSSYQWRKLGRLAKISQDIIDAKKENLEVVTRYIMFMAVLPEQSASVLIIDRIQKGIFELSILLSY
jgi:hypothetical protein